MHTFMRPAVRGDAAALAAIYAPHVNGSSTSFELVAPTADELWARVVATTERFPWLVREEAGEVVAYAYATPFRTRPAYRWTVETSVYVRGDRAGRGHGRAIMRALLIGLERLGYRRAVAGITLPNQPSVRLHEDLGFACVGHFPRCGHKLGAWHDVGFWQLDLAIEGDETEPEEPRPPAALDGDPVWLAALTR